MVCTSNARTADLGVLGRFDVTSDLRLHACRKADGSDPTAPDEDVLDEGPPSGGAQPNDCSTRTRTSSSRCSRRRSRRSPRCSTTTSRTTPWASGSSSPRWSASPCQRFPELPANRRLCQVLVRVWSRAFCTHLQPHRIHYEISGGEEIRTPGQLAPSAVFKTAALDHSATPPEVRDGVRLAPLSASVSPRGKARSSLTRRRAGTIALQ